MLSGGGDRDGGREADLHSFSRCAHQNLVRSSFLSSSNSARATRPNAVSPISHAISVSPLNLAPLMFDLHSLRCSHGLPGCARQASRLLPLGRDVPVGSNHPAPRRRRGRQGAGEPPCSLCKPPPFAPSPARLVLNTHGSHHVVFLILVTQGLHHVIVLILVTQGSCHVTFLILVTQRSHHVIFLISTQSFHHTIYSVWIKQGSYFVIILILVIQRFHLVIFLISIK